MTFATRLALFLAVSPIALVTFALAMGSKPAVQPLTGVACEITVEMTGNQTTFTGRITPEADTSGNFAMSIARTVSGVSSTSRQAGTFSAAAGETVTVGRSVLGGDPDGVEATMTVTVGNAARDCPLAGQAET